MNHTITIVEDCAELRHLMSLLVAQEMGLPCLCLGSFAEVLADPSKVLKSTVVILDINLGAGQPDGVQIYRWLRENHYLGRIFFFTGHAKESPQIREAASTGIPILEKPMSPNEIVVMLNGVISEKVAHA